MRDLNCGKWKEGTVQILCGCDAATRCPQDRVGAERQCVINIPEDDLFRIVMELPEFNRRYAWIKRQPEEDSSGDWVPPRPELRLQFSQLVERLKKKWSSKK